MRFFLQKLRHHSKQTILTAALSGALISPAATQSLPGYASWDEVKAEAEGTQVNFYMWGGSDAINGWVDDFLGTALKEKYDIELNRVPISNTADVVNQIISENVAGVEDNGAVDVLWVNGDNFKTLKEAELLYGPWSEQIPNAVHVKWDDPSIANDFGVPVEGYEAPWGAAQFVYEYNSATLTTPPSTFEALKMWLESNKGGFTYPAPPDFTGMSFIKHIFLWAADDPAIFQKPFNQSDFDKVAPKVWSYLNEIKPNLWREGQTYPGTLANLQELLANGVVDFSMVYDPHNATNLIKDGVYPDSINTFVFDSGTLTNKNYVAIPKNASHKAAAMILANHILSTEFQLIMADPDRWGWDIPTDISTWTEEERAQLANYDRGKATLPVEILSEAALPEPHASWIAPMRQGWIENVLEQ